MTASTVAQYLAALPADRRAALSAVRKTINENLADGYEEGMQFGMIGWYVPLSVYPAGYGENPKVPLPFVALASQKSGMVLHFLCFYGHPTLSTWFTSEYKKSGKKLDMGKGCVRFKSLEDLALDVRFAGRELYGGRPRARASWSREAGAAVLVKTDRRNRCPRLRRGAHRKLSNSAGTVRKRQRKKVRQVAASLGVQEERQKLDMVGLCPVQKVGRPRSQYTRLGEWKWIAPKDADVSREA